MKLQLLKTLFVIASSLVFFSCTPDAKDSEILAESQLVTNYSYSADELKLVDVVNNYRISNGLKSLEIINHVSFKSQEHNSYMITNNVVNHDFFDARSTNIIQVVGAKRVAENIAYNFATAEGALFAWLQSDSHKVNLDGDYTHIGISITVNPENGKKYYTNMFVKK